MMAEAHSQEQNAQVTTHPEPSKPEVPDTILIRMWPKTPVLYPVAVFALICSVVGSMTGIAPHLNQLKNQLNPPALTAEVEAEQVQTPAVAEGEIVQIAANMVNSLYIDRILGIVFLVLLAFTLFTLCLDLEVRWAIVLFSLSIAVILLVYVANLQYAFMPDFLDRLFALSPMATPQFYASIFIIWVILMILSLVVVRFHYVRVESNEIMVVGGMLQKQQRFPTNRMHYTKDIQDVFEYYLPLVNSGRLIISFSDHPDSIVIDNVMQIDKVAKQLDEISGVMQVRS